MDGRVQKVWNKWRINCINIYCGSCGHHSFCRVDRIENEIIREKKGRTFNNQADASYTFANGNNSHVFSGAVAQCSTSDHDICVKLDKYIVTFVLHSLQYKRRKRNFLRCTSLLRIAPIIHVGSVVFGVVFVIRKSQLIPHPPLFLPQDVAHIHLLVYLGTSMQSVVLRQNVAEVDLVPNSKYFLQLWHHHDHHHHDPHPTFHSRRLDHHQRPYNLHFQSQHYTFVTSNVAERNNLRGGVLVRR